MKRKKKYSTIFTILLVFCSFLFVYSEDISNYIDESDSVLKRTITDEVSDSDENLEIYYLDVGQADSILIIRFAQYSRPLPPYMKRS